PYDGGVFHQAPLLLAFFNFLPSILVPLLFVFVDYLSALQLVEIAKHKAELMAAERWPEPPADYTLVPSDIGTLYLLNPYSIITCLAQSTLVFSTLSVVMGIRYAIEGNRNLSMLCIAVAAHLSFYPLMMVAPCVMLLVQALKVDALKVSWTSLSLFGGYLAGLLGLSYLLVGSWRFLQSTYGVILFVPDLTPNIGLFWYFFIEMFDQFRPFFLCVFQVLVFIFVIPIVTRFRQHPLFVACVLTTIAAIFKSYPSVGDTALYLALLSVHHELFTYMRNTFLVFNALVYASILGPLFFNLWLYAGSGNANFFYAITLVFGLAQIILIVDVIYAMIRREWERYCVTLGDSA
ncbi:GPI transamidase subunit PIG-U, partial [Blyttiomyces helicus]